MVLDVKRYLQLHFQICESNTLSGCGFFFEYDEMEYYVQQQLKDS